MIVLCEPTCRRVDHEKVNSGFIGALNAAYPGTSIRLYADKTHIEALAETLARHKISIDGLEWKQIRLPGRSGSAAVARYVRIFDRMLDETKRVGADRVYFLSVDADALLAVKELKRRREYAYFKFSFVMHGIFESIADDTECLTSRIVLPYKRLPRRRLLQRLSHVHMAALRDKVARMVTTALDRKSTRLNSS